MLSNGRPIPTMLSIMEGGQLYEATWVKPQLGHPLAVSRSDESLQRLGRPCTVAYPYTALVPRDNTELVRFSAGKN